MVFVMEFVPRTLAHALLAHPMASLAWIGLAAWSCCCAAGIALLADIRRAHMTRRIRNTVRILPVDPQLSDGLGWFDSEVPADCHLTVLVRQ